MKKNIQEKIMNYKKPKNYSKIGKKKEELPSFLSKVPTLQKDFEPRIKSTDSKVDTGAIFFGVCRRIYPPLHSLNLTSFKITQHIAPSRENFLEDILLPRTFVETKEIKSKPIRLLRPRPKKLFRDLYPHKCPGLRKAFKFKLSPFVIDIGETTSRITGETSREIPYCRLKKGSSGNFQEDVEIVKLSDIREKNRVYLSPEERAAHSHFPKEFVTVEVKGPKIPASILITNIPSKRRKFSEYKYEVLSKIAKAKEENDENSGLYENLKEEENTQPVINEDLERKLSEYESKNKISDSESEIIQVIVNEDQDVLEKENEKEDLDWIQVENNSTASE